MDDLVSLYLAQLLNGCNCVTCRNPYCRSSESFQFQISSYEKAELIAKELATKHKSENHLCKTLSPLLTSPDILIHIFSFKEFFNCFVNGQEIFSTVKYLHVALLNPTIFCFLFLASDEIITANDLNFNMSDITDFITTIRKRSSTFDAYQSEFTSLVGELTHFQDNCLHTLRGVILLFVFGSIWKIDDPSSTFIPVINFLFSLSNPLKNIFYNTLTKYPNFIILILNTTKRFIQGDITEHPTVMPHSAEMHRYAALIELLAQINETIKNPFPYTSFSSNFFSDILLSNFEFDLFSRGMFSYLQTPAILSLVFKKELMKSEVLYITNHISSANAKLKIEVTRNDLLFSTFSVISELLKKNADFHARFQVSFKDEKGVDAGGISREFFQLVFSEIFPRSFSSVFPHISENHTSSSSLPPLSPNKASKSSPTKAGNDQNDQDLINGNKYFKPMRSYYWFKCHKALTKQLQIEYEVIGALVGLALYNGVILPVRFPNCLFRKLFGRELRLCDLGEIEPEVNRSLQALLDDPNSIEDCYLTFTTTAPPELGLPKGTAINLIPKGSSIDVTKENVHEFIKAKIEYELSTCISEEFQCFSNGFLRVCNTPLLRSLNSSELSIFLSGEEGVDVEDLKNHAEYREYTKNSQTVVDFWEIFESYEISDKQKLLSFITGSPSSPIGGVVLTIERLEDIRMLPTAHTCFNTLSLPDYRSKQRLKQVLAICLENTEGFGIV